jgi:hypothetical protein
VIASGINLGRKRGEFEQAAKILRSAQNGHRDPVAAGFLTIERAAELCARAAAFFNGQRKEGRLLNGVPDEKWARATAAEPLRPLDSEHLHVFLPETTELSIRGGHVFPRYNGRTLAFCEPELFAHLGQGYRVAVRFDPTEPSLGAAILNLETGSRNQWGFAAGQLLGVADHVPDAPQITACNGFVTDDEERDMERRKKHRETVRAEYRAIGIFGRRASASSEIRGAGGVARVEVGGGRAEPAQGGRLQRLEPAPDATSNRWNRATAPARPQRTPEELEEEIRRLEAELGNHLPVRTG